MVIHCLLLSAAGSLCAADVGSHCEAQLETNPVQFDRGARSPDVNSLLERLHEAGLIAEEDLIGLVSRSSLERQTVTSQLVGKAIADTLAQYNDSETGQSELAQASAQLLERIRASNRVRAHQARVAQVDLKMRFLPLRYEGLSPFELMDTPVSRGMWWKVMGREPSAAQDFAADSKPVTGFDRLELEEFVARLQSRADQRDSRLSAVVSDHRDGDVYRLVYDVEVTAFAKELLKSYSSRFQGVPAASDEQIEALSRYAWIETWYKHPSAIGTGPQYVKQKEPFLIQGQPFFDLLGNVNQLMQDTSTESVGDMPRFSTWGGTPGTHETDFFSWSTSLPDVLSVQRRRFLDEFFSDWKPAYDLGFRLVRVRK